jgi:hypothetical protein
MSKRFIDTEIWDKSKFFDAPDSQKLLCLFIASKCDCVGVFKMAMPLIRAYLGDEITKDDILSIPMDIIEISDGVYWLKKFCDFQYGELKESCKPHRKYIEMLQKNGLYEKVLKGYTKGIETLQEKEKEKEQDKEKEKEEEEDKGSRTTIEERIKVFSESVYLEALKRKSDIPKSEVENFIGYWTEHGPNDRKMRFEKEKSFGISRRLGTWKKNCKNIPTTPEDKDNFHPF